MVKIKDTQDKFAWKVNIMLSKYTYEKAESTCLQFFRSIQASRADEIWRSTCGCGLKRCEAASQGCKPQYRSDLQLVEFNNTSLARFCFDNIYNTLEDNTTKRQMH
jgi:hypothetical protein